MATMKSVTSKGSHLDQLKKLASILAANIDDCEDPRALPALAKQYRETIQEIESIEGVKDDDDEIGQILSQRERDGKSGALRKNRTHLSVV